MDDKIDEILKELVRKTNKQPLVANGGGGGEMIYELEAYNTDCRYQQDVRYRQYTTSKKKAEVFERIPKIQFTDSGHGIVFSAMIHSGKRKPTISILRDYVRKHIN